MGWLVVRKTHDWKEIGQHWWDVEVGDGKRLMDLWETAAPCGWNVGTSLLHWREWWDIVASLDGMV